MDAFDQLNDQLRPDASADEVRMTLQELAGRSADEETRDLFHTLNRVMRAVLRPDDTRAPFFAGLDLRPDGQVAHGQYTDAERSILRQGVERITHPGLRARLADRLWLDVRSDASLANQAFESYLSYAQERGTREIIAQEPHEATDSLRRAISLGYQLGKKGKRLETALQAVEVALAEHLDDDPLGRYSLPLLRVMYANKRGDAAAYAAQAAILARRCEAAQAWSLARSHWDTAALFETLTGRAGEAKAAKIAAAEAAVQDARRFLRPGTPPFLSIQLLQEAVQVLRNAGAAPERVQAVLKDIRILQIEGDSFLKPVGSAVPEAIVAQQRELGQQQVNGLTLEGALEQLAVLATLPSPQTLETQAKKALQGSVVHLLSTGILGDHAGRQQSILNTEEDYLRFQMAQEAAHGRLIAVIAVDAAMKRLHEDHTLSREDLAFIVQNNKRIPPGHEASVQRGLWYGLWGDLLASLPILLPQLEAGLRHLLTEEGHVTSGQDLSGVQQEHNLNTFLTEEASVKTLRRVLGEAFVGDLTSLLIDKNGENLRNTVAHGLVQDGHLEDVPAQYAWILILRFFLGGRRIS